MADHCAFRVDDALAAPESVLSSKEVRAQIVELSVQARRLDAKRLRLIGSLADRKAVKAPGVVVAGDGAAAGRKGAGSTPPRAGRVS